MYIYPYDSFDCACKTPFGAVRAGKTVSFSIMLSDFTLPYLCELLLYRVDEFDAPIRYSMGIDHSSVGYNRYRCDVKLPQEPHLYFYCFAVTTAEGVSHIKRIDSHYGDFSENGELWQLSAYDPEFHAPDFLSHGIVYQIFPDRFCNSGERKMGVPEDRKLHENWREMPDFRPNEKGVITNSDYFGGDLKGIMKKLDYLAELSVSLIYLNPIFEAHSSHRYNVADYFNVDPLLGTNEDFRELCAAARERGIGIILDGVFSHTGSDSVYFNKEGRYPKGGAFDDPESDYRDWYKFEQYPQKYHSWWGFETLPEIIEETPSFLDFVCGEGGVIRYWMRMGAQGFRLDVADELPDVILDRLREAVKAENVDGILIGEVWEDASNKVAYSQRRRYLLGAQLDSVMNYPYMNAVLRFMRYGDSNALYHGILTVLENYPLPSVRLLLNSLSTHDTPRALTFLGGDEFTGEDREWQYAHNAMSPETLAHGKRLLLLAYTILYFLPGKPCLYYGDEAGLYGWRDPFNRTTYPWEEEDKALRAAFIKLGRIYRRNPFLNSAKFSPIISMGDIFCFARPSEEATVAVAVNRGTRHKDVKSVLAQGRVSLIIGTFSDGILGPYSGIVIETSEEL